MKATPRIVSLITLGAIIGFMFASVSCSTAPVLKAQIAIASAQESWEKKTDLTTGQTVTLLGKWWTDLQQAREVNKLLKSEPIPLGPIQATQASPMADYTSAKAILENLNPQASAAPSDDQRGREGDTHPDGNAPETPAPRRDRSKPRIDEQAAAQMLASLGRHGPDRHPAAPGDHQPLATQPQLPTPAIVIPIVHYRQSVSRPTFLDELSGKHMPDTRHGHSPSLPTAAVRRVEVIGADNLPAF